MPNGTYGGVRGRKTKVGRKLLRFPPTRLFVFLCRAFLSNLCYLCFRLNCDNLAELFKDNLGDLIFHKNLL